MNPFFQFPRDAREIRWIKHYELLLMRRPSEQRVDVVVSKSESDENNVISCFESSLEIVMKETERLVGRNPFEARINRCMVFMI